MKKCAVVIPVYKNELSEDEYRCVLRYFKILRNEDIYFIAPKHLNDEWYNREFPECKWKRFKDKYFTGTKSYNHLMLDEAFYRAFGDYEYMLIAQTDACILDNTDRLEEFMEAGYDYIGAPWIPERRIWEWTTERGGLLGFRIKCCKKPGCGINMGNGGFCLRNINHSIDLIHEYSWRKVYWFIKRNEDIFFGVFGRHSKCGYKLADVQTGLRFAREYDLRDAIEHGEIPFGVHGWKKEFQSFAQMEEYMVAHEVWEQND